MAEFGEVVKLALEFVLRLSTKNDKDSMVIYANQHAVGIVRAIAESNPLVEVATGLHKDVVVHKCDFCHASIDTQIELRHTEDCIWTRAKAVIAELD